MTGRTESSLRAAVIEALEPLHAIAVENPALPGTPDVNYIGGWIELKSSAGWPSRKSTPLRCDHWTPQQKVFHLRRSRKGGRTWVLLQVGTDYLLLDGETAVKMLGKSNREQLEAACTIRWHTRRVAMDGLLSLLLTLSPEHARREPAAADTDE